MPNLHRLRVVNFTETVNERESVAKKKAEDITGKVLTYKTNAIATEDGGKAKENLPKSTTDTTDKVKKRNNFCSPAKKISFRSTSELFRVRHYNDVIRSLSSKRTWSFPDVRNKVKSAIKQKKISQRKESKRNTKHQPTANRHAVKSQDDIKVLYSYERRKNKNNRRDLSPQVDRGIFKRSSSEIFGAGNRFRKNTYLCYQTCRSTGLFRTPRRKRRTESKPCILREVLPLDMGNCKAQKCTFQRDNFREHYNLVGFPLCSKKIDPQQRAPYPLRPVIVLDCEGDVKRKCVNTQCVESVKEPVNEKCPLSIRKLPSCAENYYTNGFSEKCNFEKKDRAVNRFFRIFKSVLKYILLSLTIVAWLPCIIIVGACWLLVSPLRPNNVCNKSSILNKEYSCCVPIKCEQVNIVSSMMKRVACKCQHFAGIVQEVMNNTNNKLPRQRCRPLPTAEMPSSVAAMHRKSSKWKPNPDKKYVLYYDDPRGWLMKPVRNQGYEDSNQNHIVQNINWFGQKSDKTVTFRDSVNHCPNEVSDKSNNCACPELSPEVKSIADECAPASNNKLSTKSAQCGGCVHKRASVFKKDVSRNSAARPCSSLVKLLAPIPVRKKPQPKRIQRNKLIVKQQQPLCRQRYQPQITRRQRDHQPRTRHVCRPCTQETCHQRLQEDQSPTQKKVCKCCKFCADSLKETVNDAEQTWDSECGDNCNSMFLCTLKHRPCFWVYRCCPSMYPDFLFFYRSCANCCYIGMFVLAACIWCPIFLCCYLCYHLVICCFCDC